MTFKKRYKQTQEHKTKIALANTGRKASDETKHKQSLAKIGKPSWNKNHNHPKYESWKKANIIAGKKKKGRQ